MRTLIVNSMFASTAYRRCADELGKCPGMELTMLTVDRWRMNNRSMPFEPMAADVPYATVVGKAAWRGFENRGFYTSGLRRAFQISKPEVLFLMEEPFSVFALELMIAKSIFAPQAPIVFFTWNNLSLTEFDYRPSFFYRNVARQILPRMAFALTANADGVSVLRSNGFDKPVHTIGYGVDTARYRFVPKERINTLRERLSIAADDRVIGYVGRLLDMKGVDLLIEAFAQIREKHSNIKLLLVGSGESEFSLLQQARDRGIMADVRHVPSVAQHEVPDYMHVLDVLVLPSRRKGMWAEQFGRVLVEAMAAGTIVIGSDSGAIPEVIADAGFVFPENDARALARSMETALSLHQEEKRSLLERASNRADYFSWERFAKDSFEALTYAHRHRTALQTRSL